MVVAGTRPEIIKMEPIVRSLRKNKIPTIFVNCGQHYDYDMAQRFIENLELPSRQTTLKKLESIHRAHRQ